MTQAATIADQFMEELDQRVPVTDFRARRILQECQKAAGHADTHVAARLYFVAGLAHHRLHDYEAAAAAFLNARRLGDPNVVAVGLNLGAALMNADRFSDAALEFANALRQADGTTRVYLLANLAETLSVLGLIDDSNAAFQEAIDGADFSDPRAAFCLAMQAAEIGADAEAVEFYARYLAARARLSAASPAVTDDDRLVLDEHPKLRRVLARAARPPTDAAQTVADGHESPDALGVYEATRASRMRANTAVLMETGAGGQKDV